MYIRVTKAANGNTSKVYLVEGYRDEHKKIKQRIVKCYGELSELQKTEPNILERLRREAKELKADSLILLELSKMEKNSAAKAAKNYGYFFLDRLWHELGIGEFFAGVKSGYRFEYDLNSIMRLLSFSRILEPASKKSTFENSDRFFEDFDTFSLDDVYRSLSVMSEIKEDIQLHLHQQISKQYKRDCSLVFYDVTNYYFETECEDDFRKKGVSKEHRPSPLVQMGLFLDGCGIPIAYKLFAGNTNDKTTLQPALTSMRDKYELGKIIVVGDKGINTVSNRGCLKENGDGYVVSSQIRKRKAELIERVLDESGYAYNTSRTFKKKSWIEENSVTGDDGKTIILKEKVVCFWSKDYEAREKHKRGNIEDLIERFRQNPALYTASNSFGIKKYLKEKHLDKSTGEITKKNPFLDFDKEKYERDCALDGYYMLVTSELDLSDEEVIEKYRGLWKIEDSFRVLKSDLEGRPVYVRTQDHIEGHFLICFIALTILRLLQQKLKVSAEQLQLALNSATCHHIDKNVYLLQKQTDIFKKLFTLYKIDLDKKYLKIEQIRSLKKLITHQNTTN